MAKIHTHYDNLKVARNAPPEVIRAAYKTLSQRFHPDRNPGDAAATRTFQIIHTAYEVLSDPVKRKEHDDWIERQEAKEPPVAEPLQAEIPPPKQQPSRFAGYASKHPRHALKTVALSLKGQTAQQRAFTYLFCGLVATLVVFIVLV
jgi:curved DNA-binding protein CbpA